MKSHKRLILLPRIPQSFPSLSDRSYCRGEFFSFF